ncbi:RNA degradosome polyphosphate kinase [Paracoccaceae bacterium GXU_MW_L88]
MTNSDFLTAPFRDPVALDGVTMESCARLFNRELSWLAFNWRVLEEAENPKVPLLERVRFVSISGSNLDEFFSVRVAGLRGLVRAGISKPSADGMTPEEQLRKIDAEARKLMDYQQDVWRELQAQMSAEGLDVITRADLTKADIKRLEDTFMNQVFPVLTPIAIDPAHPFPFIANNGFALALSLIHEETGEELHALLPVPAQVDRFIEVETPRGGNKRFLPLEGLLEAFLPQLFPRYRLDGSCAFRVLRDGEMELEEEAEDLVREFESALKRRRRGDVIRLEMSASAPEDLHQMIVEAMHIDPAEVIEVDGVIGVKDLSEMIIKTRPDLVWPRFVPRMPERVVNDHDGDIFAAIRQKDMLLHHPYETFDIVVRFLQQAARDPNVVAIKQTLYRTAQDSPIVDALCEAAEDGKSVTALVELKARFDEAANIRQSRKLERSGVQVVYGFMDWKTHAKVSTVVRREGDKLVTYSHYGTGNYHHITANIYTDLSFFTTDPALGRDSTKLFNYVSGYALPTEMENLQMSPHSLKQRLIADLEEEAKHAKAGRPAHVWIKCNSIIEPQIIDAFYKASQAGVKIEVICRGICGIRPGVKGLSENIRVKSIVGRFLEHSRIYCFGNGDALPNTGAKVYMSSADLMGRNLNRRIEHMVQIHNPTVHSQILDQIMAANLADTAQSWVLNPDGTFDRHVAKEGERLFNCHKFFMENPSMSGRGSAGIDDVPRLTHSRH